MLNKISCIFISFLVISLTFGCNNIFTKKNNDHETLLFKSLENRPDWIPHIPGEDNKYKYFVGISSENVLSEKEAKKEAVADARTQLVEYYGTKVKHKIISINISNDLVNSTKISKEFESQFAQNEANFVLPSQVYSEKWLRKSSIIRWKTYVLCTVPKSIINKYLNAFLIEIERVRNQKEKKRKECYQFLNNSNFLTIKGNSYTDINKAKNHAIELYNNKMMEETQKRFDLAFSSEHKRELSCPDINDQYYYIVGINYDELDQQAANEIVKRAKDFDYDQMQDLLNKNKRLFSKFVQDKQHAIFLSQIQPALQYVKENRRKIEQALTYESKQNYFESLKLLSSSKYFKSEFFINDIENIFNEIVQNKQRLLILYYKDIHLQISKLLNSYEPYNIKDLINQNIKEKVDKLINESSLFEKEFEINDNQFYQNYEKVKKRYKQIVAFEMLLKKNGFIFVKNKRSFYICDHEVTVSEYIKFYNKTHKKDGWQCSQKNRLGQKPILFDPYTNNSSTLSNWKIDNNRMKPKKNKSQHPMNCVSWDEATMFINWLNDNEALMDNYYYRLCSASEWEYAARNQGTNSSTYICGNDKTCLKNHACFNQIKNGTCKTKSKKPNKLGLYDMSGNVSEWVFDDYPIYDSAKMEKGGSYWSSTGNIKLKTTSGLNRKERSTSMGFRLCISK